MGKTMGKVALVVLGALLLLAVSLVAACAQPAPAPGPAPAPAKVFDWKLIYYAPPQDVYDSFAVDFAEDVTRMSGGRLKMTPYPEGTIVPATEMLEATKTGTVEMACLLSAYFSGVMPVSNIIYGFPATYRSYQDKIIHHEFFGFGDIVTRAYAEQGGVVHLGTDSVDGGYTLVSNVPITKADDFKGMKLRATGAVGEVFKELGASVIFCAGSELYTALATGVVDGCVYGGPQTELDQMKFAEVVDYLVLPFLLDAHGHSSYIVNPDAWNALPDDLKAIVQSEVESRMGDWYPYISYQNQNAINEYTATGAVKISQMSDEEFAKVAKAGRTALERLVADKNDPFLTEGAASLVKFMEWRGYW